MYERDSSYSLKNSVNTILFLVVSVLENGLILEEQGLLLLLSSAFSSGTRNPLDLHKRIFNSYECQIEFTR